MSKTLRSRSGSPYRPSINGGDASHRRPLADQLHEENQAMVSYALSSGLKVPPPMVETLESARRPSATASDTAALVAVHAQLSQLVAPATPRSILAMRQSDGARPGSLGSVRLVRKMMLAALFSVMLILVPSALSQLLPNLFNSGFQTMLSYVAAAGLGASFYSLIKANRYVVSNTFDPRYEPTYWVRFTLGVIAGTLIGIFVDVGGPFGKHTLAALGGFSADAVQRILNRLVEAVVSVVRGETAEIIAAHEQSLRSELTEDASRHRLKTAMAVMDLQRGLRDRIQAAELDRRLQMLIDSLVDPDTSKPPEPRSRGSEGTRPTRSAPPRPPAPPAVVTNERSVQPREG